MSTDVANSARELRSQLADLEVGPVDWVAETGSTNADLATRARSGERRAVLLAESQTAGRGRRDRSWEAPVGANLLLSVLVTTTLDSEALGAVPVALAVATTDACLAAGVDDVGLKWPNDVVRPAGKVGGLLAEVQAADSGWAIVAGLGLNVGWPEPGEGPPGAARLGHCDRVELAAQIIRGFICWLAACESDGTAGLHAAFVDRCVTIGQRVALHRDLGDGVAPDVVQGVAVGVDERFRILVSADGDDSPQPYDVGDVVHLRPSS